ncbi:prepilin-type N-terminal cleavage/methylation domain-containing protein [Candidatus Saccharibacteria bacterium]|nr:prepilin-type N-terminal cleavage/methylation domain-containing protein [Candidatus Saccharibacteria bacterium]
MANKKIKSKNQKGFTIVELLIVIVVIGILAAITIVAYSGITNRGYAAQAMTNAENIQKVAEAMNADTGAYPVDATALTTYSATAAAVAKIPTGVTTGAAQVTTGTGKTYVQYLPKGTTGGCIQWWDYAAATPVAKYDYVGNGVTGNGTTCV